jgi:hypothetical protein
MAACHACVCFCEICRSCAQRPPNHRPPAQPLPAQLGYNFLYGLWLFQWDADCELFLKVLTGETREEVFLAQVRLQGDIEELLAALDKAKGQATGVISKASRRDYTHTSRAHPC